MKRIIITAAGLCVVAASALAQPNIDPLWFTLYPTHLYAGGRAVAIGPDSAVYAAGFEDGYDADILVAKFSTDGEFLWSDTVVGPGPGRGEATAVGFDSSGTVYVIGSAQRDTVQLLEWFDVVVARYPDAASRQVFFSPGAAESSEVVRDAVVDRAGRVYVAGEMNVNWDVYAGFAMRIEPDCSTFWYRTCRPSDVFSEFCGVDCDDAGNLYAAGHHVVDLYNRDIHTARYSPEGNEDWVVDYDGGSYDGANALVVDDSGDVFVAGYQRTDSTHVDGLILKYTADGGLIWTASYNRPGGGNDFFNDLAVGPEGSLYATGSSGLRAVVVKFRADGTLDWACEMSTVGESHEGYAVAVDAAGNAYVAGTIELTYNRSACLAFMVDTAGRLIWYDIYQGDTPLEERFADVAIDHDGCPVFAGQFDSIWGYPFFITAKYRSALGVVEGWPVARERWVTPTIVSRGTLLLPGDERGVLFDAAGREVVRLCGGENDLRHLSPGVYYAYRGDGLVTRKVIVTR